MDTEKHPRNRHVRLALRMWLRSHAYVSLDSRLIERLADDLPDTPPGTVDAPLADTVNGLSVWLEQSAEDWRGVPEAMTRAVELLRRDLQDGTFAELVSHVGGGR